MPKKTKRRIVTVDMSGVESGGKAVPDGVYAVVVHEISEEEGDKGPYLKWVFKITDGPASSALLYDNLSLSPKALWKLKGLLETLGVEVPDSSMELDLEEYIGMEMTVTIANEEYQGKDRPKISQYGGELDSESRKSGKPSKSGDSSSGSTSKKTPKKDEDNDDDRPEAGDVVKFTDDGKEYIGKIKSIEDDMATVVQGKNDKERKNGDEWEIPIGDLEAVDE